MCTFSSHLILMTIHLKCWNTNYFNILWLYWHLVYVPHSVKQIVMGHFHQINLALFLVVPISIFDQIIKWALNVINLSCCSITFCLQCSNKKVLTPWSKWFHNKLLQKVFGWYAKYIAEVHQLIVFSIILRQDHSPISPDFPLRNQKRAHLHNVLR